MELGKFYELDTISSRHSVNLSVRGVVSSLLTVVPIYLKNEMSTTHLHFLISMEFKHTKIAYQKKRN
jgi:hypothetical protein